MDDAAVSVEEFLHEKEDKYVSIGLDEFLRLYDQHENRMIANMTTMASKNTPSSSAAKNTSADDISMEERATSKAEGGAGRRSNIVHLGPRSGKRGDTRNSCRHPQEVTDCL